MCKCSSAVASRGPNSYKAQNDSPPRGLDEQNQLAMFQMVVDIHKHICARRLKCRRGGESRRGKYRCGDPAIRRDLFVQMDALLKCGRGQEWAARKTIDQFKSRNRDPGVTHQTLVRYYRAHRHRHCRPN